MSFTTGDTPTNVELKSGAIYRFRDAAAPAGYRCWGYSELDCTFNAEGKFLVRETSKDAKWEERDPRDLIFYYHKDWNVLLSKVAEDNKDVEQSGAKLQFGWPGFPNFFVGDSGAPEFPKNFVIAEGIPYTFSELSAPEGYEKHGDIVFTIDEHGILHIESGDGFIDPTTPLAMPPKLVMINKKAGSTPDDGETPGVITPSEDPTDDDTDSSKKNKLPSTGESNNHLGIYATLLLFMGAYFMKKIPLKKKL